MPKRTFYTLVAVFIVAFLALGITAYNSGGPPSTMGHSIEELEGVCATTGLNCDFLSSYYNKSQVDAICTGGLCPECFFNYFWSPHLDNPCTQCEIEGYLFGETEERYCYMNIGQEITCDGGSSSDCCLLLDDMRAETNYPFSYSCNAASKVQTFCSSGTVTNTRNQTYSCSFNELPI